MYDLKKKRKLFWEHENYRENTSRTHHLFFSKIKLFREVSLEEVSRKLLLSCIVLIIFILCYFWFLSYSSSFFFFIFAGDFLRPREFQTTECRVTSDCSETKKRCKSEKGAFTRPAWSSGAYFDSSVISNPSTVPFFFIWNFLRILFATLSRVLMFNQHNVFLQHLVRMHENSCKDWVFVSFKIIYFTL